MQNVFVKRYCKVYRNKIVRLDSRVIYILLYVLTWLEHILSIKSSNLSQNILTYKHNFQCSRLDVYIVLKKVFKNSTMQWTIAGRWQGEARGADGAAAEANKQLVHQPKKEELAQQFTVRHISKVQTQEIRESKPLILQWKFHIIVRVMNTCEAK